MRDGSVLTGLLSAHVITVGGQRCTLSITRDISERKRTEIAMRRSEQRASDLIDGAMDAIISVGTDQRIVRFNRAANGCSASAPKLHWAARSSASFRCPSVPVTANSSRRTPAMATPSATWGSCPS